PPQAPINQIPTRCSLMVVTSSKGKRHITGVKRQAKGVPAGTERPILWIVKAGTGLGGKSACGAGRAAAWRSTSSPGLGIFSAILSGRMNVVKRDRIRFAKEQHPPASGGHYRRAGGGTCLRPPQHYAPARPQGRPAAPAPR